MTANYPVSVHIRPVERDSDLAMKLRAFVEASSWSDVKAHILWMIDTWVFTEWETMFVAIAGERIVGMASIMKTDYYPLPEIYPWISCIFVTEDFRGNRISGKLIDCANEYASSIGFDRTYIPSEHVGLYEHYGYRYIKDIVNYGQGTDRLYMKEI